ncbi:MAG: enoyl-CoA hydratase-related protein [Burkholderiaceae bacterium]
MNSPVLYETADAVATITLNRPDSLNALSSELMTDLRRHVETAEHDTAVRAVLITGAGRGFSSGADLAEASSRPSDRNSGQTLRERYHPVILALRRMPKPVISAVNGVAAGAGMSLALSADIVLAARSASFLQAFARIGLVPDAGSTWLLDRYAGSMRARALAMLAERIPAEQARDFGLVWQVHDDDQLMPAARGLAARMAAMPTRALGLIKRTLDCAAMNPLAQQLEVEADHQVLAQQGDDFKEGVRAFIEKRPPKFTGK